MREIKIGELTFIFQGQGTSSSLEVTGESKLRSHAASEAFKAIKIVYLAAYTLGMDEKVLTDLVASSMPAIDQAFESSCVDKESNAYAMAAQELFASNDLELDEHVCLAKGDDGAWVSGWVWVSDDQAEKFVNSSKNYVLSSEWEHTFPREGGGIGSCRLRFAADAIKSQIIDVQIFEGLKWQGASIDMAVDLARSLDDNDVVSCYDDFDISRSASAPEWVSRNLQIPIGVQLQAQDLQDVEEVIRPSANRGG
jgi:hypothetical protein